MIRMVIFSFFSESLLCIYELTTSKYQQIAKSDHFICCDFMNNVFLVRDFVFAGIETEDLGKERIKFKLN